MTTGSDVQRRRFLCVSTAVVGAAGIVGGAWPFLAAWRPSARARAAGAPVTVDFSRLEPGQQVTVQWRRQPVWVLRRTSEMLATLETLTGRLRDPASKVTTQQPDYARNEYRSIRPEYLIVVALCTHLGCVPAFRPNVGARDLAPAWPGGYYCPCHGSRFDFAGRVFEGVPAPLNLVVPPYRYVDNKVIIIGEDTG